MQDSPSDDNDAKEGEATSDEDILAEAKDFLTLCTDFESENRVDALDDLEFLTGNQWDSADKVNRQAEGRPCLTVNKLVTFLHQVTNQQRQNKPGIKVHPVDDGADIDTAEVEQGMIRHIEYASNADVAYDTAVNCAAACGFGYFRLITEYCDEKSFDQDIRFKRIRNPFTVYCDPFAGEPDGSDQMRCMLTEQIERKAFIRQYGEEAAGSNDISTGTGDAVSWTCTETVRVAEYYRIEMSKATLYRLPDGSTTFDLPSGISADMLQSRQSAKRKVMWYKMTGAKILERAEIPCRWIPVFPVYGDEWDIDGKIRRSGVVRYAKDPQKTYNFWITAATEQVALIPRAPFIGAEGQFEGYELDWQQANRRTFPYLQYKPVTIEGTLAPAPQRQPMADIPSGMMNMAMHASDNIKATTGLFDSSLGARGNATSGIQERSQQMQGDVANFHYSDNLARSIRHAGRCILAMIPRVYDTSRVVSIMGDDEKVDHAQINQPMQMPEVDERTGAIKRVLNDLTRGKYDVTVSVGPSYSTKRQEAVEGMLQMAQSYPKAMDVAGDLIVRNMDWPQAEEMAERLKRTIPAQITQDEEKNPVPPQIQQQMDQQMQVIQALQGHAQAQEQALDDKQAELDLKRYEIDSKERIAQEGNAVSVVLEQMKLMLTPFEELGGRIQQIEAALSNIADHVVPAVDQLSAQQQMPTQQQPPAGGFFPPEGI